MHRHEKLHLCANAEWCHCFKQGMFVRFMEQGLYWFSHTVRPLKPLLERAKGGAPVIYGGLPVRSFEKLLMEGALKQAEITDYGWRWPYAAQESLLEDLPDFAAWRATVLSEVNVPATPGNGGRNILEEVAAFNLAAHTPMQAMNAIARWQEALRG